MKRERTIAEAVKIVLQGTNDGLTDTEIYNEIVDRNLYEFGAKNPLSALSPAIRRSCTGVIISRPDNTKLFQVIGYRNGKPLYGILDEPVDETYDPEEEKCDNELLFEVNNELESNGGVINSDKIIQPTPKKELILVNHRMVYPRSREIALRALAYANFLCEVKENHPTFKRKRIPINYTEPHHLIPLQFHSEFDYSLDVETNIVSVCSNCHNDIHYGEDEKELLKILYLKKRDGLMESGISVSYNDLLEMYHTNIKDEIVM